MRRIDLFKGRTRLKSPFNLIWVGIGFSVFYWMLESVRDSFIFKKGPLIERIFFPDPISFWMRFLVVCLIVLFSAFAYSLQNKITDFQKGHFYSFRMNGICKAGVGVAMLYWILESIRDVVVFNRGSVLDRILTPDPMCFWMRLLAVFTLLLFSIYAQMRYNEKKQAVQAIRQEKDQLTKEVEKRTAELSKSHEVLKALEEEIAERKKVEKILKENEEKFRTLTENINVGIYRFAPGPEGKFLETNPAFLRIFGFHSKEESLQIKVSELFQNSDEKKKFDQKISKNGYVKDEEVLLKKRDGSPLWCSVTSVAVHGEKGDVKFYDGVIEDITVRKAIEEALRESENNYRAIFENTGTAIVIIEEDTTISLVNTEFERISGYSKNEVEGKKSWVDLVVKEDHERMEKYHRRRRIEPDLVPSRYSCRFIDKSGNVKDALLNVALIPGTRKSVVSALDITEQMQVEKEKEKMQAQLLQAQKMEAIGVLAGGIAHDFNNLLTAILGSVDMALLEVPREGILYKDLIDIQTAAQRATDLIKQLLLFSRNQPMKGTMVHLNETVEDVLMMLHRLIGEDIEIITDLDPNLWTVFADNATMGQVIMNLVVNARDAMPEGGRITIKTHNVVLDEIFCETEPQAQPGKYICLSVSDTGVGMDKKTTEHIFDPFYTTKDVGEGTGLGLSIIYGIVKQHEGWVHVSSELGKGSDFQVYLKALNTKPVKKIEKKRVMKNYRGEGKRILVIEDEEGVREFIANGLNRHGYTVFKAANAEEAETIFVQENGRFHMVFSDVILPGKNGIQLAEEFISQKPDLRIVLSSGYAESKQQNSRIQKKGFSFLGKPYSLSDLLSTVGKVVEHVPA